MVPTITILAISITRLVPSSEQLLYDRGWHMGFVAYQGLKGTFTFTLIPVVPKSPTNVAVNLGLISTSWSPILR